jgi:SAM-dependent methyltransferase
MVTEYNTGARNQGISEAEMCAHVGNLLDPASVPESLSGAEFHDFDVAAVGMGFHHFPDPALASKRLADRLRKGGVLFIVDFVPHADPKAHSHGLGHGHGPGASETVIHFGFSEEEVRGHFEAAGVGNEFEYVVLGKGIVLSHDGTENRRSLFMARGVKG